MAERKANGERWAEAAGGLPLADGRVPGGRGRFRRRFAFALRRRRRPRGVRGVDWPARAVGVERLPQDAANLARLRGSVPSLLSDLGSASRLRSQPRLGSLLALRRGGAGAP